ncbi:hypothetical protein ABN070_14910 [Morganella morganii]|uniref:hypothetical protein n=1 Tax=Morganella morganii TaxID=582 RepID=UPI0032DBEE83
MKKYPLLLLLFTTAVFAKSTCMSNLTQQDMCIVAKKITSAMQKELPVKITENMVITTATTEQRRVILTASLSYNLDTLIDMADGDKEFITKAKAINKKVSRKTICENREIRAFINLGGEVQYDYIFNDGSVYDIVTITSCDNPTTTKPETEQINKKLSGVYPTPDSYENSAFDPIDVGFIPQHEPGVNPAPPEPSLTLSDAFAVIPTYDAVNDYNPFSDPHGLEGYELWADKFISSQSPQETEAIKKRIDARREVLGIDTPGQFSLLIAAGVFGVIVFMVFLYRWGKRH